MVGRKFVINLRLEYPSLAREDFGLAPRASKEVDKGSYLKRLPFTKKVSRPAPQASKKGRRVPERRREPRVGVEDFVPWVALISSLPLLAKMGKRWLTLFITLERRGENEVPVSSGQQMLPSRLLVRLINTQPVEVRKSRR